MFYSAISRVIARTLPTSRNLGTACPMVSALTLSEFGQPQQVLSVTQETLPQVGDADILVDILAAPINPSDINCVEGRYPIKPALPGVPGFEGVGRVREAGPQAGFSPGDWVIPRMPGEGTWRQAGVFLAANWHRVPNTIPVEAAATIFINPPTALRMLEECVPGGLVPGDCVIQNGANSAVGQYVVQMARDKGLATINVVRERPDFAEVSDGLQRLGATLVTTEARLKQEMGEAGVPRPRLALNCVGGTSATAIAKALGPGGVLVTYGGMSMQPVCIPTSLFIFKGITARGFWLSGGDEEEGNKAGGAGERRMAVVDRIAEMYVHGKLQPTRTQGMPLERYSEAFDRHYGGFTGAKLLFAPNQQLYRPAEMAIS